MTATLTWWPDLITSEPCDRCGQGAQVRVIFAGGSELVFCGHHARRYRTRLLELAVLIQWSPDF